MTPSIPVDLFNPGQVFGCLGLMEIAQELFRHAEGRFEVNDTTDVRFVVHSEGQDDPIAEALRWVSNTEVAALVPRGRAGELESWNVEVIESSPTDPFPIQPPRSAAVMPAVVRADGQALVIDSWGDETGRDKTKWWAGMAGYPGARLLADAVEFARERVADGPSDPFSIREPRSSSFRFDPRGEYVPRQTGFSPNQHGSIQAWGFPVVDVLASIGLNNARPLRPDPSDKLTYQYGVLVNRLVDVCIHRAVLGCADLPHTVRWFRIQLDWPGQENQARSITSVTEMSTS